MDTQDPDLFPEGPHPRHRRRSSAALTPRRPGFIVPAVVAAAIFATVFVSITPDIFSLRIADQFRSLISAQEGVLVVNPALSNNLKIGIVAGHMGLDSGAVCDDGTTEADVNFAIATLVQKKLAERGYPSDLLKEKDEKLQGYKAALLLSIHNDSCVFVNDEATGFKVARAIGAVDQNISSRLLGCMKARYQETTGLPWHNSVTRDMTEYHAFEEIDPSTPAAIIETGFLNLDYDILTKNTDKVAQGVANGILCYLENENVEPTPTQVSE